MNAESVERRFPIGAEVVANGVHFRVWAPARRRVELIERRASSAEPVAVHVLARDAQGYHAGLVGELRDGSLYSFRLDGDPKLYPDPASRFQPEGVHGPSQVVDPSRYRFTDHDFKGPFSPARVIYELHIGTFTPEGTYRAAAARFGELRALGITTLELMPLADFTGEFGWGYDGVDLWAPSRLYGEPEELRALIDYAHGLGMEVILDVVYNHLGPDGNYLGAFTSDYFSKSHSTEWGDPPNFDGENCQSVREFFINNARYWIEEFHFDGLRLDATQSIFDDSQPHIISEIVRAARAAARALGKSVFIVAENEPQHAKIVRTAARSGYGCDALWNDDLHHTARVALTGRREAYYTDYQGTPQELISGLKWGYLYQGQYYAWQEACRGAPALDLSAKNFVSYLQNHDQVANSVAGLRLHQLTSPGELRAMTALVLLAPPTPMLFQGQEFAASAPFLYFADPPPELAARLHADRCKFLEQFPSIAEPELRARIANPAERETFERCKLDWSERARNAASCSLHRDLLALRQRDPVFSSQRADQMHGAVLGESAFLLRFISEHGERLIVVNLGAAREFQPAPEPLLAPPADSTWQLLFSSEDPQYGGFGSAPVFVNGRLHLAARSTHVFAASPV